MLNYNDLVAYMASLDEEINVIKGVDKQVYIQEELAEFDKQQAAAREEFIQKLTEGCEKDQAEAIKELEVEKAGLLITLKKMEAVEVKEDQPAVETVETEVPVVAQEVVEAAPVAAQVFPHLN